MIYTSATGNNRTEKEEGKFFMDALKEARAENKAIAEAIIKLNNQALSHRKDYIGPVELLFIPS